MVHGSFDAHWDEVRNTGSELLNLPLPPGSSLPAVFKIKDPDQIVRIAERDPQVAVVALVPDAPVAACNDWPDELASCLRRWPELSLGRWASANGLAKETLSRGFRKAFGIAPARFRTELQAQRALRLIEGTDSPLADISVECGFSDQPHLTRVIVRLTGRSPGSWRRGSIPFKTG
jgi:AraC-like DNA-binding protein